MNQKIKYFEYYYNSKVLLESHKQPLKDYFNHYCKECPDSSAKYVKAIFRVLKDFGAFIQKPYSEVNKNDFKGFYNKLLDLKSCSSSTIDTYQNILRRFFSFQFSQLDRVNDWKLLEVSVLSIFRAELIAKNRAIDEKEVVVNKAKRTIQKYLNSSDLLVEQQTDLKRYYEFLSSGLEHKSIHTISSAMRTCFDFAKYIKKPFNIIVKDDLISYFSYLYNDRKLRLTSMESYKSIVKSFFKFYYGTNEYPEIVSWIKVKHPNSTKKEEDMLTPVEIKLMIEAIDNPRDRCMLSLCYESGARHGELMSLKIKNLQLNGHYCKVCLTGKTGTRVVTLVDSLPYIEEWLNYHLFTSDPESYLFLSKKHMGRKLCQHGFELVLKNVAKRVGIKKRIHPHLLRHSRAGHLAKDGWNERDLRIYFGWSANSNMPNTYLHYNEVHVHNKILQMNGLAIDETKADESLKPKVCPICRKINPTTAKFCRCGQVLDGELAIKVKETMQRADEVLKALITGEITVEQLKVLSKN